MSSPLSVKKNNYIKNPKARDISTPEVVANFIASLYPNISSVLDPSIGGGELVKPFLRRGDVKVISYNFERGEDFLLMDKPMLVDLVVCNPPFNLGVGKMLGSERFLRKIIGVCGETVQIVLFCPMGFRLNQRKTSARWRWLRDSNLKISSILSLPLDIFENVAFHSEILFFNSPHLQTHYFLPSV